MCLGMSISGIYISDGLELLVSFRELDYYNPALKGIILLGLLGAIFEHLSSTFEPEIRSHLNSGGINNRRKRCHESICHLKIILWDWEAMTLLNTSIRPK
jgi:hypothetical protein